MKNLMVLLAFLLMGNYAHAIPAFARKEGVSCTVCHTNGSAPHLTEFGYNYRRMAFHIPGTLGNKALDASKETVTKHSAVIANVAIERSQSTDSSGNTTIDTNGITVPELAVYPRVGGFYGNFGSWNEVVFEPGGDVGVETLDVRYAKGTSDNYYNLRAGLISPEGYGASDQWLSDGGSPLMDNLAPNLNQDTLSTPWGAMGMAQYGAEAGYNLGGSHLTLGMYNGVSSSAINEDGTVNADNADDAEATPTTAKQSGVARRDVRLQLDQFLPFGAITAGYYNGTMPLASPDANFAWNNHYDQSRLYLTVHALPSLDILGGVGQAHSQYVNDSSTPDGTFKSTGNFIGAMYYLRSSATLAARMDNFHYNANDKSDAISLQANLPYENRMVVLHVDQQKNNIGGEQDKSLGAGVTFRFLF